MTQHLKNNRLNIYALCVLLAVFVFSNIVLPKTSYQFNELQTHKTFLEISISIFIHNYAIFLADLCSFVLGRWLIIVSISVNMGQLGWVLGTSANPFRTFLMLAPHGIFEITAILLMANLCWKGVEWAINNRKYFGIRFLRANMCLFIAALIEGVYLTVVN
jgi:uncharacterized membrane protein SpoIIM required for sporulation